MKKTVALAISVLSTAFIVGCGMVAPATPKADAYFFLFTAHTTSSEVPVERQIGLLTPPQVFATQADCEKVAAEATTSTQADDAKKWLADHQIDKLKAVCVPVNF